jgi:hypothetical protein
LDKDLDARSKSFVADIGYKILQSISVGTVKASQKPTNFSAKTIAMELSNDPALIIM